MKIHFKHLEWQCQFDTESRIIRTERKGRVNNLHVTNAHTDLQQACMSAVAELRRRQIPEQFNALETFK